MTVVQPRVSAAGNRFTIAFLRAIAVTPMARAIVTTAGSPSGIAATARETDPLKATDRSYPNHNARIKLRAVIKSITITRILVKSFNFTVSGVMIFSVLVISSAIWPICVCSPVATTIPDPIPLAIKVPLNSIHF